MSDERLALVRRVFEEAVKLPTNRRAGFLARECAGNPHLLAEVQALLDADQHENSVVDLTFSRLTDLLRRNPEPDPLPFLTCGDYRLVRRLGGGGMGEVFLAERIDNGNRVAIKVLKRESGFAPDIVRRFEREKELLGRLQHPNIARFYHSGIESERPWFAMDYIDGRPIDSYCKVNNLALRARLELIGKLCAAIAHAHVKLVVHCDVTPNNILVTKDGEPHLVDFGIARMLIEAPGAPRLTSGPRPYSVDYASPEQIQSKPLDTKTDSWSLGAILYMLLAGQAPFVAEGILSDRAIEDKILKDEPSRPSTVARGNGVPSFFASPSDWKELDKLCLWVLRKEPEKRCGVNELGDDIGRFLRTEPLQAQTAGWRYVAGKFLRRNRARVAAAAAVVVAIAGLIAFFTARLAGERDRADRERGIATAMNRFLSDDLLEGVDPFQSANAGETFAQVVKGASPRIDMQFKAEPLIAARLHQTLAHAFDQRSDFPQARQEYEQADRLFQQAEGPLSEDSVMLRLQRTAMEARSFEGGSLARAKSLLADAERTMARIAKPRKDLAVWLYTARGAIAISETDARTAEQNFSAALRTARADTSFDETAREKIKELIAFSYIRLGDGVRAEPLFREVIATLTRTAGPDKPDVLRARIYLAQSLYVQHKYADAIQEANAIYPNLVQDLGEDHEAVLTLLGARAASEGSLARWDDAIRDDLAVYRVAVKKHGPDSLYSIGMLSDAALSQCRSGQYTEGEANARKAFQESGKAFGPRAGLTGGVAYALAFCLNKMNKLSEAAELLQNIDVSATAQQAGDPSVGADVALLQGEVAARRGDFVTAKHFADLAATTIDAPSASTADKTELQTLRDNIAAHAK
jgi:eukaryotic-like serine/threonine-protein kinase